MAKHGHAHEKETKAAPTVVGLACSCGRVYGLPDPEAPIEPFECPACGTFVNPVPAEGTKTEPGEQA
jgi:hypothetical protein